MHRLSGKFHLIPTSRHLRLCEYIPRNQKGRQAALPGLRTAKMQTGAGGGPLMGWSGRAPAPPASEAGKGLNDFPSDVVELAQRSIDRENRIQDQGGLS